MITVTIQSQFAELSARLSQTLDQLLQIKEEIEMMEEMTLDFFSESQN